MSTDNSKYGISKLDIEKAALGDFDDYVPSEPEPQVQPVIPVQSVYNNVQPMQDVYSNGPIPADVYSNVPVNNNKMGDTAVFCTVCGAQLPAGAMFCTGCGAQLGNSAASSYDANAQMYDQQYDNAQYGAAPAAASSFCTGCGNPIPDGYQFCTVCGAPAGAGYNDVQPYDNQPYGQPYDNDSQTLAADDVFGAQQYAQYAADDAYAYDNQDPYAADPYAAADAFVFCTNCGTQISSSLSFCTSCGAPVGGAAAQGFADPYAAAPQAPAKKGGLFSKRKK